MPSHPALGLTRARVAARQVKQLCPVQAQQLALTLNRGKLALDDPPKIVRHYPHALKLGGPALAHCIDRRHHVRRQRAVGRDAAQCGVRDLGLLAGRAGECRLAAQVALITSV